MDACQPAGNRREPAEPTTVATSMAFLSVALLEKPGSSDVPSGFIESRAAGAGGQGGIRIGLAGRATTVAELWSIVSSPFLTAKVSPATGPVQVVVAEHSFAQVAALPWGTRPRLLAIVDEAAESDNARELSLTCDYIMVRPVVAELLVDRVLQLAALDLDEPLSRRAVEGVCGSAKTRIVDSRVPRLLEALGVPRGLKGFAYLADGIILAAEDPSFLRNLANRLYPFLAKRYTTTATRVERDIRHAVDAAWVRGNLVLLYELFGTTVPKDKGKPTNKAFLARVAEEVRTQAE